MVEKSAESEIAKAAARYFSDGWEPMVQGGTMWLCGPDGYMYSLTEKRKTFSAEMAEAFWVRLVDIWTAMANSRTERRIRASYERRRRHA